jgi:hypothetical protein
VLKLESVTDRVTFIQMTLETANMIVKISVILYLRVMDDLNNTQKAANIKSSDDANSQPIGPTVVLTLF